jgi:hypothetical protein
MKIEPIYFNHFAGLQSKISNDILIQLKEDANYILKNENKFEKYNSKLIGNIEKEYSLSQSKNILKPILFNLANEFHKYSAENEKYPSWNIEGIWINFQKKHEHNPLHNHSGVLSFVLWVQIPYDLKKELELPNSKNSVRPTNSLFDFVYTDFLGRIVHSPIPLDKTYEGTIVIFPSSLNHMVYPFYTSDDYRISIAGNLNIKHSKTPIISYQ